MFLTDFHGIFRTILLTGMLGLAAAALFYGLFAFIARRRLPCPFRVHLLRYLFLTYLICLALLTLSPGNSDGQMQVNFIPLSGIFHALESGFETAQYQILLNILLFLPMGIFLPFLIKSKPFSKTILIGFLATVFIESVQFFLPARSFDIDDILLNTLGCALGAGLHTLCRWIFSAKKPNLSAKIAACAILCIIPVFLGMHTLVDHGRFHYAFSYRINLPDEYILNFNRDALTAEATIYQKESVSPKEKLAELEKMFGLNGEIIREEADRIEYREGEAILTVLSADCDYALSFRASENSPCPDDAEQLAEHFLKQYGLWEDALQLELISDILEYPENYDGNVQIDPETGKEILPAGTKICGKTVTYRINEPDLCGEIVLSLDAEGIYKLNNSVCSYVPLQESPLLTPEKALKKLKNSGRADLYVENVFSIDRFEITHANLVYTNDDQCNFRLPAWEFSGIFYGTTLQNLPTEEFGTLTVAALNQ